MMDLLDRVHAPAADLLDRADDILTRHGAPSDHPLWPLVRRLGILPSGVLADVAALAPATLRDAAENLIDIGNAVHRSVVSVPTGLVSRGAAADGFATGWHSLSVQIVGRSGGADRIEATARAMNDAADWMTDLRRALAGELGACLGSSEAVSIRSVGDVPGPVEIRAAADIAVRVLEVLAGSVDDGWDRMRAHADVKAQIDVSVAAMSAMPSSNHIELR